MLDLTVLIILPTLLFPPKNPDTMRFNYKHTLFVVNRITI